MSLVTSITVVTDLPNSALQAALTAEDSFGREEGYHTSLRELDFEQAGGTKFITHRVFAAGINYADRSALREWVDALPWGTTSGVVLVDTEGEMSEIWVYGFESQRITRVHP